jgi:hypothetical protein
MRMLITLVTISLLATVVEARDYSKHDGRGKYQGRLSSDGRSGRINEYDAAGRLSSTYQRSLNHNYNNWNRFDSRGRYQGNIRQLGPNVPAARTPFGGVPVRQQY